jgi:bifunctional N-acetylglucosamine-1-phosphate-uridyltransferase/glucosamine-1-phosphate-acetyltransferase GlmU-like protein
MIENQNTQNEYYLTDIVKIIKTHEKISIKTHLISEDENKYISGVNTPEELAELEYILLLTK